MKASELSPQLQQMIQTNFPGTDPATLQQVLDIAEQEGVTTEEGLMQMAQEIMSQRDQFDAKSQALSKLAGNQ